MGSTSKWVNLETHPEPICDMATSGLLSPIGKRGNKAVLGVGCVSPAADRFFRGRTRGGANSAPLFSSYTRAQPDRNIRGSFFSAVSILLTIRISRIHTHQTPAGIRVGRHLEIVGRTDGERPTTAKRGHCNWRSGLSVGCVLVGGGSTE